MASNDVEVGDRGSNVKRQKGSVKGKRRWRSWLIPTFVVANVVVFIITMYVNDCPANQNRYNEKCVGTDLGRFSFQPTQENPLFGPSSRTLYKMGALQRDKIVNQNEGWRLISCIWLHAGVIHLGANMISLIFIGIRLEQQFGFVRIGIIYLLSGFGGSILSALFIRKRISVGASGALFGLLGAMLSELITNWSIYSNKIAAFITLVVIVVINLVVGIVPFVDNFAHIGGFATGFLLGFVFLCRPQFKWMERHNLPPASQAKSKYKLYQLILLGLALILLVAWFVVGLLMLFRGENADEGCHWCHYLNCVPTSKWDCDV